MMSDFSTAFTNADIILADGGIETRILYETHIPLVSEIEVAGLLFTDQGKQALANIYNSYLDVSQQYQLPMILGTPTFRANPHRVTASHRHLNAVIREGVDFLVALKKQRSLSPPIFIAGVTGPKNDAFEPTQALSAYAAKTYHHAQIAAFTQTHIDFLFAPTLPAVSEALGLAQAMAETSFPFVISFVLNREGKILDGHSLDEAIEFIDQRVSPQPLYYSLSCIHPTIAMTALKKVRHIHRILEIKANASRKSTTELMKLNHLDKGNPSEFAQEMQQIHRQFGVKVLGGCCGTDQEHIKALAHLLISV